MSQRGTQVFSSDPTLVSYLAQYFQEPSCTIEEVEGKFFLRSSYFEALPTLPTLTNAVQHTDALGSVIYLLSPEFDKLPPREKVEKCIEGLLLVLNGIIKLKYKAHNGLTRFRSISPDVTEPGIDVDVDAQGHRVYTATKGTRMRVIIAAGSDFFRDADKQSPSTKKIWDIAMNNSAVARALYYYAMAKQDAEGEPGYIFNALQEIEDHGGQAIGQWEPVKVRNLRQWAHNAHISRGKARHPVNKSDPNKAQVIMQSLPSYDEIAKEAREFIYNLLMGWIQAKS